MANSYFLLPSQGNDRSFIQKSHATHRNNPHYGFPKISSASEFLIIHFAGTIAYSVGLCFSMYFVPIKCFFETVFIQ